MLAAAADPYPLDPENRLVPDDGVLALYEPAVDVHALAELLVDALRLSVVRGQMLQVALSLIATRDRELAAARRQIVLLRGELRRFTATAVRG
jgi:hypothetical protein